MSEPEGTLAFRVQLLERDLKDVTEDARQTRHRQNNMDTSIQLLTASLQTISEDVRELRDEMRAQKRSFYTFALSVVGSTIVFAFVVFQIWGTS